MNHMWYQHPNPFCDLQIHILIDACGCTDRIMLNLLVLKNDELKNKYILPPHQYKCPICLGMDIKSGVGSIKKVVVG